MDTAICFLITFTFYFFLRVLVSTICCTNYCAHLVIKNVHETQRLVYDLYPYTHVNFTSKYFVTPSQGSLNTEFEAWIPQFVFPSHSFFYYFLRALGSTICSTECSCRAYIVVCSSIVGILDINFSSWTFDKHHGMFTNCI